MNHYIIKYKVSDRNGETYFKRKLYRSKKYSFEEGGEFEKLIIENLKKIEGDKFVGIEKAISISEHETEIMEFFLDYLRGLPYARR